MDISGDLIEGYLFWLDLLDDYKLNGNLVRYQYFKVWHKFEGIIDLIKLRC